MTFTDNPLLQSIVDGAPIGICILNVYEFKIESLNNKFLELFSEPRQALVGQSYWDCFGGEERHIAFVKEAVLNRKQNYISKGSSLKGNRRQNDQRINITLIYAPVVNNLGEVTKIAVWAQQNIDHPAELEPPVLVNTTPEEEEKRHLIAEQANNNLEQILNMLPASVVVIRGYDLIVEKINDTNLNYWQRDRDEVVGRPFLEILPDLADQPFASQLRRVMETGEVIDVKESPVLFTDTEGRVRETFVDYTYQALRDIHGNRNGVLVMSFEITDRVLSKRLLEKYFRELTVTNELLSISNDKLAQSEARFKYLINEAPVAIGILHGRDLIVETANAKLLEVWGKTNAVIGLPLSIALPEISDQAFVTILQGVLETGKPFIANEILAMLEHGGQLKEIFFNLVYQPVVEIDGTIEDILVVAVDISEQVNSRKKVEQSEEHFKKLADLVPAKISNALPNGEVTFFNQQWLDFAGMGFEELRDSGFQQMMHPDEIAPYQMGLSAAAVSGEPYVSEMRFKDIKGEYVWHLNIVSPILNEDREVTMWVGSTTNIQLLKNEEQRKNDFIGMVSHELKTPLTSLSAYLQLLQRKTKSDVDIFSARAFEQSRKQVSHMTTMINGFLDISRLESGKIHIERTTFNLKQLLQDIEIEHQLLYSDHCLVFKAGGDIFINADRNKIAQVINNLVSNAAKYSPVGSEIEISFAQHQERARVKVRDQGIGIRQEELHRLFERFYRVENHGTVSGFGIGLYLSAEIIDRHAGKIWAESEIGKGSVFLFEVPIAREF